MRRTNHELLWAALAIIVITAIYLIVLSELKTFPPAGNFFGHTLGIIGFILMLMTETLYSLRKRSRLARWGKMSDWLSFHIFTGIVGPYMVLLHTSWKFNGLAGIVTLLTIIIVVSGFIGRYIYTKIPRTAGGAEIEVGRLEQQIADLISESQGLDQADPIQAKQLDILLNKRYELQSQVSNLAKARRTLSLWHTIHIPIGLVLFCAAFFHIYAALYYATFLH